MAKEFDVEEYLNSLGADTTNETVETESTVVDTFDVESYLNSLDSEEQEEELPSPEEILPPPPKQVETSEEAEEDELLTYQQMSSDADYMDMLREYQEKRFGDDGKQQEDETDEEYLRRFVTNVREFELNSIDMGRQLNWIRSADEEDRVKFGYLYSELDNLQSFYNEGTVSAYVSALRDTAKSLVTDPLTYLGFGAGKAAAVVGTRTIAQILKESGKSAATRELAKRAAKRKAAGIVGGGLAVEGALNTVEVLKQQELEQLSGLRDEKSLTEAALIGGATTVALGGIGVRLSGGLQTEKMLKNARESLIKQRTLNKDLASRNKEIRSKAAQEAGERVAEAGKTFPKIFDIEEGRVALDKLGELAEGADDIAQIEFNTQLMKRVGFAVQDVVEDLAESGRLGQIVDADTTASEVIGKIVKDSLEATKGKGSAAIKKQTEEMLVGTDQAKGILDKVTKDFSGDALQAAISRAGLTNKQFVDAFGASYTNAGKFLQTASPVGRILKRGREIDPDLAKEVLRDSASDTATGMFGSMYNLLKRVDSERRALMVSMPATTIRNVLTGGVRLGFEGAANLIEGTLYHTAKGIHAAATGELPVTQAFNYKDIVREGFGRVMRLKDTVGTANLTDDLLAHNPQLAAKMNRTLQEIGEEKSKDLSSVTKALNGLNMAQDILFRRAIFTDHLDKKLRRAGLIVDKPTKVGQFKSLEELAASGKQIPTDILADGVDEAMYFTFSRTPQMGGSRPGDSIGSLWVKINEGLPMVPGGIVGTGSHPFSRFMVNAMQFQLQYSPVSVIPAVYRTAMAVPAALASKNARKLGDETLSAAKKKEALNLLQKANADMSKGIVGIAALTAAIKYRAENQDVNFWLSKNGDGTSSDLRPLFPLVPYLAIADLIVKAGAAEQVASSLTLGVAGKDGFVKIKQPEVVADIDVKEVLSAVSGAQLRTGTSTFVVENAAEVLKGLTGTENDAITNQRLAEIAGEYVGTLAGGITTPARVVRDVMASFDTESAIVRDARQAEGLDASDRFNNAVINTVMKDLPGLANNLPQIESPTREGPVFRQSPLEGQTTGIRREMKRNIIEAETERLGIKTFTLAGGTGDKKADALIKGALGPMLENQLDKYITSEEYQNKSPAGQRSALKARISVLRKQAKAIAEIQARNEGKPYTVFDRAQFAKLTDDQTRLANEYYEREFGKTVIEMQEEDPDYNHIFFATNLGKALSKIEAM